jgi:hypothetical protein
LLDGEDLVAPKAVSVDAPGPDERHRTSMTIVPESRQERSVTTMYASLLVG